MNSEPSSFQQAFERLLARAPGPVFPRARALYLQKYPLEGESGSEFRTFLLEEEIQESAGGALRIRALALAIVAWGQSRFDPDAAGAYLERRWGLHPGDLQEVPGASWFRDSGAYGRFGTPAVYERVAPTSLLSSSADPVPPAADPG
ncbi:hypothetical protein VB738_05215 [Cyanobium gracile UHCC 0139]|uniref:Uncharacterized protein n=1 Tax=Cyanobium gracile UHCC 0139 TaxID=3110308 RepID=A0ABU5RS93_9CYAN|nr:hypothetical protein [Cyanobium gracile]MEA5390660.1 hypothetical protein [Cyanobium gracile UHCC 0139]